MNMLRRFFQDYKQLEGKRVEVDAMERAEAGIDQSVQVMAAVVNWLDGDFPCFLISLGGCFLGE